MVYKTGELSLKSSIGRISIFLPLTFPALSIVGAWLMNTAGNNSVSMFLLLLISGYVLLVACYSHLIPEKAYPLAVLTIGVSLLFMYSLRSNHIMGYDINYEYFVFQLTKMNARWSVSEYYSPYNTVVSITILPTIYSGLLNVGDEYVFKVVYQMIFSLVPLGLYQLYKNYMKELYAFLAAFFFMSNFAFSLQMTSVMRQEIALFFFVLSMLMMLNERICPVKRRVLFVIFGVALVVSHYLSAYVYVVLLLTAWSLLTIFKRYKETVKEKSLTMASAILFFVTTFFWYGQATQTTFANTINYITEVFRHLQEFFVLEVRSAAIAGELSPGGIVPATPNLIGNIAGFVTKFFIFIGILYVLRGREKFKRFSFSYISLSLVSFGFLIMNVAVPQLSVYIATNRLYLFCLVFLAPFCVLGGKIFFTRLISRPRFPRLFLSVVVVVYFLSSVFFIPHLFGCQIVTLDNAGYHFDNFYVRDHEIWGAEWLSKMNPEEVYADFYGRFRLTSYGMITQAKFLEARITPAGNTYFYLRYLNVVNGEIALFAGWYTPTRNMNMTEFLATPCYMDHIKCSNLIYNNGGTQIYNLVNATRRV